MKQIAVQAMLGIFKEGIATSTKERLYELMNALVCKLNKGRRYIGNARN